MADVRPLPGIRYTSADLASLVTPPYDVISPEAQARYYARHPHNIIRLELGRDEPHDDDLNNRYTRAAATFADWRLNRILQQDPPALYLYEQRFTVESQPHVRSTLLARVRLQPWEAGVILPHERTLSKPKDDRLKLYRACAANLSPIMALYDDPAAECAALTATIRQSPPTASLTDEANEEHRLWLLDDPTLISRIATFFRDRPLYIADGHHRYETGLAYRDEVARTRKEPLTPDDPANFTLMALAAVEDPGLVVLPTHRILTDLDSTLVAALPTAAAAYFTLTPLTAPTPASALAALTAAAPGQTSYILVSPTETWLLQLTDQGRAAMAALTGPDVGFSPAWRALDLAALHELLLRRILAITPAMTQAGAHVSYTRDATAAFAAVHSSASGSTLAALVNPTPPAAIRDIARAGDRMPQKSTYFYPKLITGLVINPLW